MTTPSSSDTPQAIRLLYGHLIGKELLHATMSSPKKKKKTNKRRHGENEDDDDDEDEYDEDMDDPESWRAEAHFTNANYQAKKTVFLLFVNRA